MSLHEGIESHPWSKVEQLHENELQDQLNYLSEESDYYRRKFDEWGINASAIDSLDDFFQIPFTTKQDERNSQADTTLEQPLGEHQAVPTEKLNRTISSSGTSGKPTYFGLTENDREAWNEVLKRFFYTAGIRPDDTVLFGVGQTMVPGGVPYFEGLTQLGANAVPAGGGSTERLLGIAHDLSPDAFFSTVSHGRYLIERASNILGYELSELPIDKVILGGEPGLGTPEIREEIHEGWGAKTVRNTMGLGDIVAGLWAECSEEGGMHYIGQEYAHPELIDLETEENLSWKKGLEGELVYTPLAREATPLLRFQSGDYAKIVATECACGRTSPRIQVIGRTDNMLIYKGMNVFPSALREVIADIDGTTPRVRVVVPDENTVKFQDPIPIIVGRDPDSEYGDDEIVENIVETVRAKLQVRAQPTMVDAKSNELAKYKTKIVITDDEMNELIN